MTLVGGLELLAAAERGGYAVPGFNVSNVEMALAVIDAAEDRRAPIFLQFNPSNLKHIGGMEVAASLGRTLAARALVPVALHLDHGPDLPLLRRAMREGFTSLMFDGSTYPIERNRRETMEAYAVAQEGRLPLEAELGHVGGREPGVITSEAVLTDPEAAARFVQETRVDSLAVSVGTAHGLAGRVDVLLVREIRAAVRGLPLVLHGGSGLTPRDLRDAVLAGIRKVNISSEIHAAFASAIAQSTGSDPRPALNAARAAVATVAAERIDLLGAARRA
ncbi:MAG: class II fructose-bisphosphate aldolase [Chloroflexi bacterium]|nr:class II fructose-bisphosphate aldolase [Chloroflexota bacterium]MDA1240445.1 class II fructose-bisphosphate aldolase [Chloroflexota bacterium]MQC48181.1 class II fructose-bisphosphate aldolase [Chloroflexota bacterium]